MNLGESSASAAELRRHMIEEAAYYRAQRRGFTGGDPVADWLEAEAEIDGLLANAGEGDQREPGEQLESELRAFDAEIKRLLGKARRARAGARSELERELEKLRPLRATAETKLSELRERSGEAWEEVRKGADRTREELSAALTSIVNRWR